MGRVPKTQGGASSILFDATPRARACTRRALPKAICPVVAPPLHVVNLRHLDVGLVLGHLSEPRLTLGLADLQGLQLGS